MKAEPISFFVLHWALLLKQNKTRQTNHRVPVNTHLEASLMVNSTNCFFISRGPCTSSSKMKIRSYSKGIKNFSKFSKT
jgi:hypothetical protein